jgi:competence protein ComEC
MNKNNNEIIKWILVILMTLLIYKFVNKDSLIGVTNRTLPPTEAALLNGIVWGDKAGFQKDFYTDLKNAGLVHLVVVSGSNLMLLAGGVIGGLAWILGRKKTLVMTIVLGAGYAAMVGWELPVVRALLMMGLMYLAQLLGRKYNVGRGLLVAVVIMFLADNRVLLSLSFWLSVTAFIGVITNRHKNLLMEVVWINLWITPIIGLIIGKIAWVTPLTNVVVIGTMGIITGVGVLGMVTGGWLLWLVYPMLRLLATVTEIGGGAGVWQIKFNWCLALGWYVILIYWILKRRQNEMADTAA